MILNVLTPTVVIQGFWNPAVLQPPWVAVNLFEYPSGEAIQISIARSQSKVSKEVFIIDGIGFYVDNSRVEIYLTNYSENLINKAEEIVLKLLNTLSHTPLGGYGINFIFTEDNIEESLVDAMSTNESINSHYQIIQQVFSTHIKFPDCILKLTRTISDENVTFDFNYHHEALDLDNKETLFKGAINKYLKVSKKLFLDVYSINEIVLETGQNN